MNANTANNSSAIELGSVRDMLRLYCQALAGRSIELHDLSQLLEKEIGWSRTDVATTDGSVIFLPAMIDRFDETAENFAFLKVMLTQQTGHLEFGSFDFEYSRPSTRFEDLRPKLMAVPEYHDHDHGHEADHDRPSVTELTRFFKLFPDKRSALDIFSLLESSRVEARIMHEYPGLAKLYERQRQRVLALRPEIIFLPAREALIEFMIRLSLGAGEIKIPTNCRTIGRDLRWLVSLIAEVGATVEDCAEATVRTYNLLARVKNVHLEEDEFVVLDTERNSNRSTSLNRSSRWSDEQGAIPTRLPSLVDRERHYLSPAGIDYRGEFRPELAQLLTRPQVNAREQRKSLTAEQVAELLRAQRKPKRRDSDEQGEERDPETEKMVHNLMRELERRDPRMQSVKRNLSNQAEEDAGPLIAAQPNTFLYDEWNVFQNVYRNRWCRVWEKTMMPGDLNFYRETLARHRGLLKQIRGEFEQVAPELYRKEKRVPDGADHDLDAAIEAITELRAGISPSEKIFWRHHKIDRDLAVAFLLDMSGSTGEAIGRGNDESSFAGAGLEPERRHRRIIDVEKEAMVLMMDALESIGDRYGVYGFSGHGRENVEFYVVKGLDEEFSPEIAKRLGRISPLHATRMGPAIRHTTAKLRQEATRSKFLFLISDGRPQDRGYSQEDSEKLYAVQDTRAAFAEARREGIQPFCLTVDKEGNDYLRVMMDDFSYEVLADVSLLPERLPQLYRKLTR
jgi:nitric oxide reductase NorD protein